MISRPGQLSAGLEAILRSHRDQVTVSTAMPDDAGLADVVAASALAIVTVCGVPAHRQPAVSRILGGHSSVPVVVFTELDDDEAMLAALRQGAAGYLVSGITGPELLAAVTRAAAGQVVIDPTMAARLALRLAHQPTQSTAVVDRWQLRTRESEVLELLVQGRTNQQIAEQLCLGKETVKTHLRKLYRKLGARDRFDAVAIACGRR